MLTYALFATEACARDRWMEREKREERVVCVLMRPMEQVEAAHVTCADVC